MSVAILKDRFRARYTPKNPADVVTTMHKYIGRIFTWERDFYFEGGHYRHQWACRIVKDDTITFEELEEMAGWAAEEDLTEVPDDGGADKVAKTIRQIARARKILEDMAAEKEDNQFDRWVYDHKELRARAKELLSEIDRIRGARPC